MSWHLYGLLALLLNYKEQCPTMAICLLSGDTISPQFMDANSENIILLGVMYIYTSINLGLMTGNNMFQPACPIGPTIICISYGIK